MYVFARTLMRCPQSNRSPYSAQPGVGWDNLTEALFSSVEVGDTALVQKALTAGMDVNQKNKEVFFNLVAITTLKISFISLFKFVCINPLL